MDGTSHTLGPLPEYTHLIPLLVHLSWVLGLTPFYACPSHFYSLNGLWQ